MNLIGINSNVVASANKYFGNAPTGGVSLGSACGTQNISVKLNPYGWLKLHVKNTSPYNSLDMIEINLSLGSGVTYYGTTVDTNIIELVYGNSNVITPWFVTKNGIMTNHSAIFYSNEFDTIVYNINY